MTEGNFLDDYEFDGPTPILDPAAQQSALEQPASVTVVMDDEGNETRYYTDPTVLPGESKSWEPDDVLIAQGRIDSEDYQTPFRDPVETSIVAGDGADGSSSS